MVSSFAKLEGQFITLLLLLLIIFTGKVHKATWQVPFLRTQQLGVSEEWPQTRGPGTRQAAKASLSCIDIKVCSVMALFPPNKETALAFVWKAHFDASKNNLLF